MHVSLNTFENDEVLFSLVDFKGRNVYTTNLGIADSGLNTYNVDLPSDLKAGSFIVKIDVNHHHFTKLIQVIR